MCHSKSTARQGQSPMTCPPSDATTRSNPSLWLSVSMMERKWCVFVSSKYFYLRVEILQTEIDDLNSKSIVWEGAFCSGQSYKFCLEFSYDNKTDDDFTDFCQVLGCFNNLSVLQVVVPSVKVC